MTVNHVYKHESQYWHLQKFSLLFEFSAAFSSGHYSPLIAAGIFGEEIHECSMVSQLAFLEVSLQNFIKFLLHLSLSNLWLI